MTRDQTSTQELAELLGKMEDAYWRLKDMYGYPDLTEDETEKIDSIVTSLDEFFA